MNFDQLTSVARQVVEAVQRRLPPGVAEAAATVPVCYEPQPNPDLVAEGLDVDILGLFVGHEHLADLSENPSLPPQILLFLKNIWDQAEGAGQVYRDEVRLTYLHELGHYLGWDEDEIALRGLE